MTEPKMAAKIRQARQFHIITKSEVTRAFIMLSRGEIEMKKTKIDLNKTAFDGITLDDSTIVRLLGNKKTALYDNINSVISIPITQNILESLKNSGGSHLRNSIIVNTPLEIKAVVVDFPKAIKEFITIPDCILLRELKINFHESPEIYKNTGLEINDNVKNWNAIVNIGFQKWIFEKQDRFIEELLKIPIKINCYLSARNDNLIIK